MSGAFAGLGLARGSFPVTEATCATLQSLPIGPHLSVSDRDCVDAGVTLSLMDPTQVITMEMTSALRTPL